MLFLSVNAQEKKKLILAQKKEQLKKISVAYSILKETRKIEEASIAQLNALNILIKEKKKYLNTVDKELEIIENTIDELIILETNLEQDLNFLKKEYAETLYNHQKQKNKMNKLVYFLSTTSFFDLYNKIQFIEFSKKSRELQVKEIISVKRKLEEKRTKIEITKVEKQIVIQNIIKEQKALNLLIENKKSVLTNLQKRKKFLKRDLDRKKNVLKNLENKIKIILEEEIQLQKLYTQKHKATFTKKSKSFESKKGKLGWPVGGFIINSFGEQYHRTLKRVKVNNMGVGIQTQKDEKVVAVSPGKVVQLVNMPSLGTAVIIQHGQYYTVYSKVKNLQVKSGDDIMEGQVIAQVSTDVNGLSELEFMVWNNDKKENPELWLIQ